MKIIRDQIQRNKVAKQQQARAAERVAKGGADGVTRAAQGDAVHVSPEAAHLSDRISQVASEPVPRASQERIEALREKVENGTYEVEAEKIAAAVLKVDLGIDE
ncbi:MAG: flagellar biosynthesis anti-sigma factor FlgM [Myxococcota bacterium]|nr:flagellar biosynthesis anti-sigma factor FlgM [Myxococcota bacterium]